MTKGVFPKNTPWRLGQGARRSKCAATGTLPLPPAYDGSQASHKARQGTQACWVVQPCACVRALVCASRRALAQPSTHAPGRALRGALGCACDNVRQHACVNDCVVASQRSTPGHVEVHVSHAPRRLTHDACVQRGGTQHVEVVLCACSQNLSEPRLDRRNDKRSSRKFRAVRLDLLDLPHLRLVIITSSTTRCASVSTSTHLDSSRTSCRLCTHAPTIDEITHAITRRVTSTRALRIDKGRSRSRRSS